MIIGILVIIFSILIIFIFLKYKNIKDFNKTVYNRVKEINRKIDVCNELITNIKVVDLNNFNHLLYLHKYAWERMIRPIALEYNENKRFRKPIFELTFDDIFFGGFDGMPILPLSMWIKDTNPIGENSYGRNPNISHCEMIWYQYKNILLGSIGSYKQNLLNELEEITLT